MVFPACLPQPYRHGRVIGQNFEKPVHEEEVHLSAESHHLPHHLAVPAVGELVSGKYRVDGTAGKGGMGVVFSATHVELGHRVAIKVLANNGALTEMAVERFLREGKAAASLQSDHVVRIHDVGRLESGAPFMVMELLRGEDLDTYVSTHGAVTSMQAVDWILQACNAIAEAHANGIVHRDLKPANLFLTTRSDGSDCIKVLDFGISKHLAASDATTFHADLTAARQVIGSPAYMSPEQVRNSREVDHRADIWALGMTLYDFLAGRPAFRAGTFPAVCAAIVADAPPSFRTVAPDISKRLEQIVLRCLEKDPAKRFASVNELAAALRPFGPALCLIEAPSQVQPTQRPPDARGIAPGTPLLDDSSRDLMAPGPRGVGVEDHALCSNSPDSVQQSLRWRFANRRSVWLLLGVVGFALGLPWKLLRGTPLAQPALGRTALTVGKFVIRFESDPRGAEVWESDQKLGMTPLEYGIERASVATQPRTFSVRTEGYVPFPISQRDSQRDVVVIARLTPIPKPPPAVVVSSAPTTRSALRPTHHAQAPVTRTTSPAKQLDAVLDIRTQR